MRYAYITIDSTLNVAIFKTTTICAMNDLESCKFISEHKQSMQ